MTRIRMALLGLAGAVGLLAGLGAFTFQYAHGFSYFSSDPKSCVNCHIMNGPYEDWRKSSHHAAATCNDCHMPADSLIEKLVAKADNGYRHSRGFTLNDFHEPIMITPRNSKILQANCVRCHAALVHGLPTDPSRPQDAVNCVHCHGHVGHGSRK